MGRPCVPAPLSGSRASSGSQYPNEAYPSGPVPGYSDGGHRGKMPLPRLHAGAASNSMPAIRRATLTDDPAAGENVGEPSRWIGAVQFAGRDRRVDHQRPPASEPANVQNCPGRWRYRAPPVRRRRWIDRCGRRQGTARSRPSAPSCINPFLQLLGSSKGNSMPTVKLPDSGDIITFCLSSPCPLILRDGRARRAHLQARLATWPWRRASTCVPLFRGLGCSKKSSSRTVARSPAG